jgi:SAM-dependent methyltransferase
MPAPLPQRQPVTGRNWFDGDAARYLVAAEQRDVIPLLTAHIGVRGLYLRPARTAVASLSGNMLQSMLNLYHGQDGLDGDLRCAMPGLPIENDALCLGYALHSLDVVDEPEPLLAELRRVLRPEGVLFLLGLSPTSPWRLRWMGRGLTPRSPAAVRGLLRRAGLNVELQLGVGPMLPALAAGAATAPARADGSLLDPLRAGYLLIARKRRSTLTPIGPRTRAVGALQPQARAG